MVSGNLEWNRYTHVQLRKENNPKLNDILADRRKNLILECMCNFVFQK
jgi:hypothetical protein